MNIISNDTQNGVTDTTAYSIDKVNSDRYFEESGVTFGTAYNQSNHLLYDRWKQPVDITDIPRWGEVTQLDDRFLENASFLRLKNLSLSYSCLLYTSRCV